MRRLIAVFILLTLSWLSVRAIFSDGYFPMHDDTQIARVVEMGNALSEGQFPVRWVRNLGYGYGYPIFNFYGPLPYYVGGTLYAIGMSGLAAAKVMFALGTVLPAIVLFFVLASRVGSAAALAASVFYLYAPYHAVQVYVRGSVGEYWVLIFWPLIIHGLLGLKDRKVIHHAVIIGGIGVSGAILSHTLMGYTTTVMLVLGMAGFYVLSYLRKSLNRTHVVNFSVMMLLGLGVSAFFWLPAVFEMGYTNVAAQVSETADFSDHFVCYGQLWSSLWGFGGSAAGCVDGMSFMVGKLHILAGLGAVCMWFLRPRKTLAALFLFGLILAVSGVIFSTQVSAPLWELLPNFAYLQYPWRFLSMALFGISILVAVGLGLIGQRGMRVAAAVVLSLAVLYLNVKWFVPQYSISTDGKTYESLSDIRGRASAISDEYLPPRLRLPADESTVMVSDTISTDADVRFSTIIDSATALRVTMTASESAVVTVNIAYFPGWKCMINGVTAASVVKFGLPEVTVSAGSNILDCTFTDTPVRSVGNGLTFATVMALIFYIYVRQKQAHR